MRVPVLILCLAVPLSALGQTAKTDQKAEQKTEQPAGDQKADKPGTSKPKKEPQPPAGYGTIVGQFVFDGPIPKPVLLFPKGGSKDTKDIDTCATSDQYRNDLVIDAKTKGLANVFFYLAKKPTKIHPTLKKSKVPMVRFDQKGCRFIPKAIVARTDQKVLVLSDDDVSHNIRTTPTRNTGLNFIVPQNDRKGTPISLRKAESLPFEVKCDIHPWMSARWLVVDHPYATISGKDGKFVIRNLPAGTHKFKIWHERGYYLHKKMPGKEFKVKVKSGTITRLPPIKFPAKFFAQD